MDLLRKSWVILRQRWLVLLLCVAVASVGAAILNAGSEKKYTASTELFLRAPDVKTSSGAYQGDLFSRQRAQTYVNMFHSDELAQMVIDKLALNITPQQLVDRVSATSVKNTVLMVVSVTDENPQRAANIANEYGSLLGTYVAKLENVSNDPTLPPLVQVVTRASPATAKASGMPVSVIAVIALLFALVTAGGLIWFLERFDTRVRSRRQVEEIADIDIIGKLPKVAELGSGGNVVKAFQNSKKFNYAAKRFSLNVESALQRLPKVEIPPVLAVVAGNPDDEGAIVTRAVAQAYADRGRTVSIVRFTGRRQPEVASPAPADVEAGDGDGRVEAIRTVSCSTVGLNAEILAREVDALRSGSDLILIDTPAFNVAIESPLALGASDAAVLVVRPVVTTTAELSELVAGIRVLGTPTLGIVVNLAKESGTVDGMYL